MRTAVDSRFNAPSITRAMLAERIQILTACALPRTHYETHRRGRLSGFFHSRSPRGVLVESGILSRGVLESVWRSSLGGNLRMDSTALDYETHRRDSLSGFLHSRSPRGVLVESGVLSRGVRESVWRSSLAGICRWTPRFLALAESSRSPRGVRSPLPRSPGERLA